MNVKNGSDRYTTVAWARTPPVAVTAPRIVAGAGE